MRILTFLFLLMSIGLLAQSTGEIHTWKDTIQIIDEQRPRTIRVYLPPAYSESNKKFPVVYMMDGQNLFSDSTAFAGEWHVDETLDSLYKKNGLQLIVVGVDNGGEKRIGEYTPWAHEKYGGGNAKAFGDYLVNQLKPKIDRKYRTKKKDNAVIGSSLGANAGLHLVLTYPRTFKRAGLFSPSYWFNPQFNQQIFDGATIKARIYTLMGTKEDKNAFDQFKATSALLKEKTRPGNMEIHWIENGEHNERLWSSQLAECISWLYAE